MLADAQPGEIARAVELAARDRPGRGVLMRGRGRSYGDAAQVAGGTLICLPDAVDRCVLDEATGVLSAPAGVTFDALMRRFVPEGWFVPVTPGTREITVGGAVAADVHGKNHHVDGSIGRHVRSFELLLADGDVRRVEPGTDRALFGATVGGMGLTGALLSASIRMIPLETSRMVVETVRAPDLDALMAAMVEHEARHRYSVAWVDLLARGRALGRGVVTSGDHARREQVGGVEPDGRWLEFAPRRLASAPEAVPNLLGRAAVRAFNEAWFRRAPRHLVDELQSITRFFHPLDAVGHWNRLYGRRGFLQYQFVVPLGDDVVLRRVVELVAQSGQASFLAVLKRFGPGLDAPLSFPIAGWTLTLDLPAGGDGLGGLLRRLDELVLGAGGRHYLAKDAFLTPAGLRRGYPRLDEWRAVRAAVDPGGVWTSDLARRLHLVDPSHGER